MSYNVATHFIVLGLECEDLQDQELECEQQSSEFCMRSCGVSMGRTRQITGILCAVHGRNEGSRNA